MKCRANVSTTNSMDIITSMKGLLLSVVLQILCSFCNAEITFLPGIGGVTSGVLAYNDSNTDLHTICYEDNPKGQFLADRACNDMGFTGSSTYYPYNKGSLNTESQYLPQIRCEGDSFSECTRSDQSCDPIVSIICRETCEDRCGDRFDNSKTCQCNYACVKKGDCCPNFLEECTRIRLEGTNSMEGAVVIEEKITKRNVSYVCHRGKWISFEASAACADLGYHGEAEYFSTTEYENDFIPILNSYVKCDLGATSLSHCEVSDNTTTQDLCATDEQDGCCKGIVGIRCTNQTAEDILLTTVDAKGSTNTAPMETTTPNLQSGNAINSSENGRKYIYIIIGVVCAILIIIVALLLIVRSRRRSGKQHPSATTDPTVTMGNLTSDQSADTAPTPLLALEVQCVEENTYASDPTTTHTGGEGATETNGGGDEHDYTYVDVPPMRSQSSEDLVHSYMYADIPNRSSPDPSRDTSGVMSGDNDYGLIDNVLYGQS